MDTSGAKTALLSHVSRCQVNAFAIPQLLSLLNSSSVLATATATATTRLESTPLNSTPRSTFTSACPLPPIYLYVYPFILETATKAGSPLIKPAPEVNASEFEFVIAAHTSREWRAGAQISATRTTNNDAA